MPSLGPLASGLASLSGECHSSHRHQTAQAHPEAFRCWVRGGGSHDKRGRPGNTSPFPQSHPTATRHPLGVAQASSRSAGGGLGNAGKAWWLWGWLAKQRRPHAGQTNRTTRASTTQSCSTVYFSSLFAQQAKTGYNPRKNSTWRASSGSGSTRMTKAEAQQAEASYSPTASPITTASTE